MYTVTLTGGTKFSSESGVSILDSASRSKVALPYSCKTGRCSSCKCRVLSGVTHALQSEVGLTESEKVDGWVLSCVRSAESDVTLELDDLSAWCIPSAKTLPCRIDSMQLLASDVLEIKLRLPPNSNFIFIPGQYIDVIGPGGVRRSYSLAGASSENSILELHIRAVAGGAMSQYWFNQARLNDLLRLNGPLGTFFLRETVGHDLIFLATGTGIAPVKAILESMKRLPLSEQPLSVTVFWGGRQQRDLYLDPSDFSSLIDYVPVQSRPSADWKGASGYVQDVLLASRPNLSRATVYACGSDAMIQGSRQALIAAGLKPSRFYSDAFVPSGA
jgi:CDP-4-dehydro-6-deoxyglucose reductase, E3